MNQAPAWRSMRLALHEDRERLTAWLAPEGTSFSRWHPGYLCVFLYRISHYLHTGGHKLLARAFWQINSLLTGSDLPPAISIGPGLLVPVPSGVAVACRAGRNLTILMCSGLGSEIGRFDDIGAGPGLPLIGDDVTLEPHSGVLGPVRIGDRVVLKAGAVVSFDVPSDTQARPPAPRFLSMAAGR